MRVQIHPSWEKVLQPEFESSYFQDLITFVKSEYKKSSCFPPCRLTGRPSCDTIWTSNYSTDERRKSIFVRPSHLHATNAKFFIPVHFHIVALGPGHYLLRATICFLNLFFVFVPSHCHWKRSFKKPN